MKVVSNFFRTPATGARNHGRTFALRRKGIIVLQGSSEPFVSRGCTEETYVQQQQRILATRD